MDQRTRKRMKTVSRKEGGTGLVIIENKVYTSIRRFEDYTKRLERQEITQNIKIAE